MLFTMRVFVHESFRSRFCFIFKATVCQKFLEFPGDFTSHLLQTRVWLLELWIWKKKCFSFSFSGCTCCVSSTNAGCHCGSWKPAAPCWTAQCRLAREIRHKVYELKTQTELGLWESYRNAWSWGEISARGGEEAGKYGANPSAQPVGLHSSGEKC